MHVIVVSHITTGSPVALPPEVARIYVDDPDAVPARPCAGCGYLLPMRAKVRPDGTYRYLASYEGACPVCERDTRDDPSRRERDEGLRVRPGAAGPLAEAVGG